MSPVEISMKREPESVIPSAEENSDAAAAASSNKRIKTNTGAAPGSKRATRASTGAPIILTAKGSLYRAHKDAGNSWDEQEPHFSQRTKTGSGTPTPSSSAGAVADHNLSENPSGVLSRALETQRCDQRDQDDPGATTASGSAVESESGKPMEHDHVANGGGGVQAHDNGGGSKEGGRGTGGASVGKFAAAALSGRGDGGGEGGGDGPGRSPGAVSPEGGEDGPSVPRRRRGRKGRSIYRGVCVTREGKWRAVIYKERKQLYLGVYESELEAAKAHDRAARFHFPDKAMTNFDTEEEANRLLETEEQRRRVQQGVERDLAPLRRLGAFAGSSGGGGGRGSGGCADSSEMREFEPRSRVAGDGDRTRGVNGVTCGNGGDVAEDDGQDGAGGPKPGGGAWNGEITGHRSDLASAVYGYMGEGGCPVNGSGEGVRLERRSSPCSLPPKEPLPSWRQRGGDRGSGGDDRGFYQRYQGYGRDRNAPTDAEKMNGRPMRCAAQVTEDRWGGEIGTLACSRQSPPGPGPGPPRSSGFREPDPGGRDGTVSMAVSDNGWRSNAHAAHLGRWSGEHDPRLAGLTESNVYRSGPRGARAGRAVASSPIMGLYATRPHGMEDSVGCAAAKVGYVESGAPEEWFGEHFALSEAQSGAREGGYARNPRPQVIAMLEARMMRAGRVDEETAAAAEAAMEMAGYGRKWLHRGRVRSEGVGGGAWSDTEDSHGIPEEVDGGLHPGHGYVASRYPRYRERPDGSVRSSEAGENLRWDRGNVGAFEYDRHKFVERGPGGEGEGWRRYGRGLARDEPVMAPDGSREREWRTGGGSGEEMYKPGARRGGTIDEGRSRGWRAHDYDDGSARGHFDGRGGLDDVRSSYAQKRVLAAGAAAGVEPITVEAAAAAVALKHSHRNPHGDGGDGYRDRDRFVQAPSPRWPAADVGGKAAREDVPSAMRTSSGFYAGVRNTLYRRDVATRARERSDDFLPLRRGRYDVVDVAPEAVAERRGTSSSEDGTRGGVPVSPDELRKETSSSSLPSDKEKRRPLLRTKRTTNEAYDSGEIDLSPSREHKQGRASGAERVAARVSNGGTASAGDMGRRARSRAHGGDLRQHASEAATHGDGKVDGVEDGDARRDKAGGERDFVLMRDSKRPGVVGEGSVCVTLSLSKAEVDEKPVPRTRLG